MMSANNLKRKKVVLHLTEEEEKAISDLFKREGWNLEDIKGLTTPKSKKLKTFKNSTEEILLPGPSSGLTITSYCGDGCEFCLQNPCIAVRNFPWQGQGQLACNANPAIRRSKYKRFWSCLSNLQLWTNPVYLARKIAGMPNQAYYAMHQREILPRCVVQLVRDLYPNLGGVPYMGHKWE